MFRLESEDIYAARLDVVIIEKTGGHGVPKTESVSENHI